MYPEHKNALPLGEVDPVVISEVLGDAGRYWPRRGNDAHGPSRRTSKHEAPPDDRRPGRD